MAQKKFINLLQRHEPPMNAGVFEITVNQTLTATSKGIGMDIKEVKKTFYVFGERFTLSPDAVHSVYPPAGSQGEHSTTFPHIILNRSTLPWERSILSGEKDIWLALLLFDEAETPQPKMVPLDDKFYETIGKAENEPGDGVKGEPLTVIDVPQDILERVMPQRSDLEYAAHSRREGLGKVEGTRIIKSTFRTTGSERAVIIGNRLPAAGQLSTVHLVSLENRFGGDGKFDYSSKTDGGNIRLVSLKSWSFTSVEPRFNFKGMLMALDRSPSRLALPFKDKTKGVQSILSKGFLAMPHLFRKGAKAVSWYRGPLSVRTDDELLRPLLPAASADKLLVFDETTGMFDSSYAAAWQLGRLMALEDHKFSLDLYRLKRRQSLDSKRKAQASRRSHMQLGNDKHMEGISEVQKRVLGWMRRSYRLEQVPFHYLVPQEDMLPPESLRFFEVDPSWVRCLNDGAASIGRTSSADMTLDQELDLAGKAEKEQIETAPKLSGFLLRSELVAGYPGLQIAGFKEGLSDKEESEGKEPLRVLREEKLSDSVLLCIFEGEVKTVEFFQKPDVLNFGVDWVENVGFKKQLRHANGEDMPDKEGDPNSEIKLNTNDFRLVDFGQMAEKLQDALEASIYSNDADKEEFKEFTSADFALQMLEGVEMVRFTSRGVPTA